MKSHILEVFKVSGACFTVHERSDGRYELTVAHTLNSLVLEMLTVLGMPADLDVERVGNEYQVTATVGRDEITDRFPSLSHLIHHIVGHNP